VTKYYSFVNYRTQHKGKSNKKFHIPPSPREWKNVYKPKYNVNDINREEEIETWSTCIIKNNYA
jgi:hypothetical protein